MKPDELIRAAMDGKCVTGFHQNATTQRHMPAAFVVSMQFGMVMKILPRLKIYQPQKKHDSFFR